RYRSGGNAGVQQLATWVRANADRRQRVEAGLVDAETGLYNALGVERRGREVEAAARRFGVALACAAFTMEGAGGDATPARTVADACRRAGRASDVFGRMESGEFVAIAPGAD